MFSGGGGGGGSTGPAGGRGPAVIGTHGTGTRMYTAFFCIPLPSVDATKEGGGALSVGKPILPALNNELPNVGGFNLALSHCSSHACLCTTGPVHHVRCWFCGFSPPHLR